jgi:hypothetical protein
VIVVTSHTGGFVPGTNFFVAVGGQGGFGYTNMTLVTTTTVGNPANGNYLSEWVLFNPPAYLTQNVVAYLGVGGLFYGTLDVITVWGVSSVDSASAGSATGGDSAMYVAGDSNALFVGGMACDSDLCNGSYSSGDVTFPVVGADVVNTFPSALGIADPWDGGVFLNVRYSGVGSSGVCGASFNYAGIQELTVGNALQYDANSPWIGLAANSSVSELGTPFFPNAAQDAAIAAAYYPPVFLTMYNGYTLQPNDYPWANFFDIILAGAGGGGHGAGFLQGGVGGGAGAWGATRLNAVEAGVGTGLAWTFYIGAGGGGSGPVSGGGAAGGGSEVVVPTAGTLYAPGGAGGAVTSGYNGAYPGGTLATLTWYDAYGTPLYFYGGAGGGSASAPGGTPGGGGAGANAEIIGGSVGGRGGDGIGYVFIYQ